MEILNTMLIDGIKYSFSKIQTHAWDTGYTEDIDTSKLDTSQVVDSNNLAKFQRPPIVISKGGKLYLALKPAGSTIPAQGVIHVRIINKHVLSKCLP